MAVDYIDPEQVSEHRPPTPKQMWAIGSLICEISDVDSRQQATRMINSLEGARLLRLAAEPEC